MKTLLVLNSVLVVVLGVWLATMEQVLRHAGHVERSLVAVLIVLDGLATIAVLVWQVWPVVRGIVLVGAMGVLVAGTSAIVRISGSAHFEGFVLIIGAVLVVQGILTLAILGGGLLHRGGSASTA